MQKLAVVSAIRGFVDKILTALHLIKYKEQIMYIIVGGGTTVVDWVLYAVFVLFVPPINLSLLSKISPNIISYLAAWLGAVLFAYFFSRLFVFESQNKHILKEALAFFASRLFTLIISIAADIIFCGNIFNLGVNPFVVKAISTVLVIIINYITSKLFVFRKKKNR